MGIEEMDIEKTEGKTSSLIDAERAYNEMKKQVQWIKDEISIEEKIFDICKKEGYKKLNPEFDFENKPEYLSAKVEQARIAVERRVFELGNSLKQAEKTLQVRKEQFDRMKGDEE